jgi:hypothetical protein
MIYVNGDSFTAGVGLSDHEFVPEFEKYNIDNISIYDYYQVRQKALIQSEESYKIRNKELSWPERMSKILGTEVINAGEGGSSMGAIIYRTLLDLTKLQMEGITPAQVIIMLTSENRITLIQTLYTSKSVDLPNLNRPWITSIVLGNMENNSFIERFTQETLSVQSESDLLVKWLLEIALVKKVVKSIIGQYPIIVVPEFIINCIKPQLKILNISNNPTFSELMSVSDILNIDSTLLMRPINCLPDRHYDNESHEVFAHQVAKYIQTLNNKEKIYE